MTNQIIYQQRSIPPRVSLSTPEKRFQYLHCAQFKLASSVRAECLGGFTPVSAARHPSVRKVKGADDTAQTFFFSFSFLPWMEKKYVFLNVYLKMSI